LSDEILIGDAGLNKTFLQTVYNKLVISKCPKNLILGLEGNNSRTSTLGIIVFFDDAWIYSCEAILKIKFTTKFLKINYIVLKALKNAQKCNNFYHQI
jgi:hypothetical protein